MAESVSLMLFKVSGGINSILPCSRFVILDFFSVNLASARAIVSFAAA